MRVLRDGGGGSRFIALRPRCVAPSLSTAPSSCSVQFQESRRLVVPAILAERPFFFSRPFVCFSRTATTTGNSSNNNYCGSLSASTRCFSSTSVLRDAANHRRQQRGQTDGRCVGGPINYYKRLGVSSSATAEEIKAAYRRQVLQCHPDVVVGMQSSSSSDRRGEDGEEVETEEEIVIEPNGSSGRRRRSPKTKGEAEAAFRSISEAYDVLSDPLKRQAHDEALHIHNNNNNNNNTATSNKNQYTSSTRSAASATRRGKGSTASSPPHPPPPRSTRRAAWDPAGFRRGDADRVFRDAFSGKTLEEVLFDVRRQANKKKQMEQQQQSGFASQSASTTTTTNNNNNKNTHRSTSAAEDKDASVAHAMRRAAERYASRLQKRYGRDILSRISVQAWPVPNPAATPPPSTHLPFRPFPGMRLPEGVTTPPEPTLGPCESAEDLERKRERNNNDDNDNNNDGEACYPEVLVTSKTRRRDAHNILKGICEIKKSASEAASAPPSTEKEKEKGEEEKALEEAPQVWLCDETEEEKRLHDAAASQSRRSPRSDALLAFRRSRRNTGLNAADIYSIPYNMGQLYSYQRPY